MNSAAIRICTLAVLLAACEPAGPLPPDITVDRYLLQAEEQIEKRNFAAAKQAMDRILTLQAQHDLELPEEFFFRYAEVLERAGHYDEAIASATKYLTLAGRDGVHYREALRLLNSAEAEKNNPIAGHGVRVGPGGEVPDGLDQCGSRR